MKQDKIPGKKNASTFSDQFGDHSKKHRSIK